MNVIQENWLSGALQVVKLYSKIKEECFPFLLCDKITNQMRSEYKLLSNRVRVEIFKEKNHSIKLAIKRHPEKNLPKKVQ